MSEILVVGSLAYDSIKTPSGKADRTLGGSANYFSLASSLMAKVRVVGVVGDDYAKEDRQILEKRGVDLRGMKVQPGKTFFWEGSYSGDMNEAVTHKTELNVFQNFDPELPTEYQDSRFVFLANISPPLQGKVLDQCKNPTFVGMDTMNFWMSSQLPELKKVLKRVDAILLNEGESLILTGAQNGIEAARLVTEMGPQFVVVKRGEYGFVLYTRNEGYFILPAFPLEKVVDPTGAGDTFAGGFFGYLANLNRKPSSSDLKNACVWGTVLASFTIQDFGLKSLEKLDFETAKKRRNEYLKVIHLPENQ